MESPLYHVQPKQRELERAVLSRSPLWFSVSQSDRVVVQSGKEEVTECIVVLDLEILVGIVEERATGLANVEDPNGTETRRRNLECVRVGQHRH